VLTEPTLRTVSASGAITALTDQLPGGVLNFYSEGSLVCSTQVGGSLSTGSCTVTYPSFGSYDVTVKYLSNGSTGVSQNYLEEVTALPTRTSLTCSPGGTAVTCTVTTTDANSDPINLDTSNVLWTLDDSTSGGSNSVFGLGPTVTFTMTCVVGGAVGACDGSQGYELQITTPAVPGSFDWGDGYISSDTESFIVGGIYQPTASEWAYGNSNAFGVTLPFSAP